MLHGIFLEATSAIFNELQVANYSTNYAFKISVKIYRRELWSSENTTQMIISKSPNSYIN